MICPKYVYHHLGLGDHIICNGMVRHFCSLHNFIYLFCYTHYASNLEFMFRDVANIKLLPFDTENEIKNFIDNNKTVKNNLIRVGFENLLSLPDNVITFDQGFYYLANLDFNLRYTKFYVVRDGYAEQKTYDYLNPQDEKFILIIDDPLRNFIIDRNKINTNFKIIENNVKFKLFDYFKLLENAEEIHCMQTGFMDLICSIVLTKPKIYRHKYVRNYSDFLHPKGLNTIVEVE